MLKIIKTGLMNWRDFDMKKVIAATQLNLPSGLRKTAQRLTLAHRGIAASIYCSVETVLQLGRNYIQRELRFTHTKKESSDLMLRHPPTPYLQSRLFKTYESGSVSIAGSAEGLPLNTSSRLLKVDTTQPQTLLERAGNATTTNLLNIQMCLSSTVNLFCFNTTSFRR